MCCKDLRAMEPQDLDLEDNVKEVIHVCFVHSYIKFPTSITLELAQ